MASNWVEELCYKGKWIKNRARYKYESVKRRCFYIIPIKVRRLASVIISFFILWLIYATVSSLLIINDDLLGEYNKYIQEQQSSQILKEPENFGEKKNISVTPPPEHPESSESLDIFEFVNFLQSKHSSIDSYTVSHLASAIDNSLFFLLVGICLAIYSIFKPEDTTFDQKISYIFPSAERSKKGKVFLKKKINKLAIFSPLTRTTFQINEHCIESGLSYVTTVYESTIANMHNKEVFEDKELNFKFSVTDDTVDALKARKSHDNNEPLIWGNVTKIRTMLSGDSDKWRWHTKGKHLLYSDDLKQQVFNLEGLFLPPESEAQLDCVYSAWSLNKERSFDTFGVHRFTENLTLYFVNNTKNHLTVEFQIVPRQEFEIYSKRHWQKIDFKEKFNLSPALSDSDENAHRKFKEFNNFSVEEILLWRIVVGEIS